MTLDPQICDRARLARDARFDGRFFTGVLTTGIYCRPICPAPSPKTTNIRYFPTAAAAANAGLRPCLRCRPEASPGTPAWAGTSATVARALRQLEAGAMEEGGVGELATRVGVGPRHLGRLFQSHLGASPIVIAQTRRLLFAKRLLDETQLKIADIAFASGFGSVRRFNEVFRRTYDRRPSEVRRAAVNSKRGVRSDTLLPATVELSLPYRMPFDWNGLLAFLAPRAIPGVEKIAHGAYHRNIRWRERTGWFEIRNDAPQSALRLAVAFPDSKALLPIAARVRRLFDLDADPTAINACLQSDPTLGSLAMKNPGLRVPGAWSGFELAVRAILGQQVTVKGATTLSGRLVEQYGDKTRTGFVFPEPERLSRVRFARVGLPAARATAIRKLAVACAEGRLRLEPGMDPVETKKNLTGLPGIGNWTAEYIAMRALGEPDAFPGTDLGLLKAAGALGSPAQNAPRATELHRLAEAWRPWRAYAALHLWRSL